jgi:hypothetical protein
MVPSGMLRRLVLVKTDVSEELRASFIRMTRISEIGTMLAAISNRCTLRRNIARTNVSDELSASFIRVTKLDELGTML